MGKTTEGARRRVGEGSATKRKGERSCVNGTRVKCFRGAGKDRVRKIPAVYSRKGVGGKTRSTTKAGGQKMRTGVEEAPF